MTRQFGLEMRRAFEHEEQAALFAWAKIEARKDARLQLMYASLNGLKTTPALARRAKACGMKSGIPDIFLPVPRPSYHGLFIEMKRVGSTPCHVSPEQSWWLEQLRNQGYRAVVAYGWQEAVEIIENYLDKKPAGMEPNGSIAPGHDRLITTQPCENRYDWT